MVGGSRSRKRPRSPGQSSVADYYKHRRTQSPIPTMRWARAAFKGKYAVRRKRRVTRRSLSRRRLKPSRFTRRRSRRNTRPSKSFASRVLKATAVTNHLIYDTAGILRNVTTGVALVNVKNPTLTQTDFQAVQAKLNNDEVLDSVTNKSFYLRHARETYTYTNSSTNKITLKIYHYKARFDYNISPQTLYNQGFTDDGAIQATSVNSTPFMSNNFTTYNKITRVVTKFLEQGEHMTVYQNQSSKHINSDRYKNSLVVAGSHGHVLFGVGTLGYDTVNTGITTGPVELMQRLQRHISYSQLADNTVRNHSDDALATGLYANFRFANSDTGVAVTGNAGDVIP
ncbi:capsid protein [Bromus-associated circular DNA virus 2]|uniref:capsid protein n=1 Tax=Bromus-associated circular DNA virus 2 TaxID=1590155 RepID=UPI0005860A1B|nr:capsid protein [Bromus-associated circular DNA virus 2]AJC52524.1 capsid protein [Bromus-associated circular DNA virus 2]